MSKRVCPNCNTPHVLEIIYGATVVRDVYLGSNESWETDSEEIDCQEATIVYECPKCEHKYSGSMFMEVIMKEMKDE